MSVPDTSIAMQIVRRVLTAADPARLLNSAAIDLPALGPCRLLAVGKAAHAMAQAAVSLTGPGLREGIIISPPRDHTPSSPDARIATFAADHPLPTARNLAAATAAQQLVRSILPDESLLVLLSGGASSLLTLPVTGLTIDDLRATTAGLLRAGATIDDLNCVRRHCDQLKGGGLARLAFESGCPRVVSFILSDVVGDRLETIGSGPTAPDPTTYAQALSVLTRFALLDLAPAVTAHLRAGAAGRQPETLKHGQPALSRAQNHIIGSNSLAVSAAAAELNRRAIKVVETRTGITGEARDIGADLARAVRALPEGPHAIVWGGETTVTVRGGGSGGRNQELALAAAIALDGAPNRMVIAFATDGVDGNSAAAGAVVTGETAALARAAGLDPAAALAANDSNTFFNRLDAAESEKGRRILIQTGPTGTNVNDVMIGLSWADSASSGAA